MNRNSYQAIAENDLQYLESAKIDEDFAYSNQVVQIQQILEKFFKGLLDKHSEDKRALILDALKSFISICHESRRLMIAKILGSA